MIVIAIYNNNTTTNNNNNTTTTTTNNNIVNHHITVGFHDFNLRIFNLRVSNPNTLIVDIFLHDVGFQCARVSAQKNTMKFRKSTVTIDFDLLINQNNRPEGFFGIRNNINYMKTKPNNITSV